MLLLVVLSARSDVQHTVMIQYSRVIEYVIISNIVID